MVTPGNYFVCTADLPRGSDLTFELEETIIIVAYNKADLSLVCTRPIDPA